MNKAQYAWMLRIISYKVNSLDETVKEWLKK